MLKMTRERIDESIAEFKQKWPEIFREMDVLARKARYDITMQKSPETKSRKRAFSD